MEDKINKIGMLAFILCVVLISGSFAYGQIMTPKELRGGVLLRVNSAMDKCHYAAEKADKNINATESLKLRVEYIESYLGIEE